MIPLHHSAVITQPIHAEWLAAKNISLDVLRIDAIHPVISGNKWFKLQYYLTEAQQQQASVIATFGGAWSNHIAATAYACKLLNLQSVGIIRGEEPAELSATLMQAKANGMQLIFVSRKAYQQKEIIEQQYINNKWYWIPEGGYGSTGAKGAADILPLAKNYETYTHIVAAVGTGTMLAGLINGAQKHQHITGISSMKGNTSLHQLVKNLIPDATASFTIIHDYHFGGYAKYNETLISFMNEIYLHHQLPLDIVYTGKTLYAIRQLVQLNHFAAPCKILMIHSGGLQGNKSLAAEVLAF